MFFESLLYCFLSCVKKYFKSRYVCDLSHPGTKMLDFVKAAWSRTIACFFIKLKKAQKTCIYSFSSVEKLKNYENMFCKVRKTKKLWR